MKVRYKHYCGKAWVGAASGIAPSMLFTAAAAVLAAAAAYRM
jgi:hypothetical protein